MNIKEAVEISDERLERLMKTIKQVHTTEDGRIVEVLPVDPRNTSCIWDKKFGQTRTDVKYEHRTQTLHLGSSHLIFKPSIAEVLAQIPPDQEDIIVAFEITKGVCIVGPDGHATTTLFYTKKED